MLHLGQHGDAVDVGGGGLSPGLDRAQDVADEPAVEDRHEEEAVRVVEIEFEVPPVECVEGVVVDVEALLLDDQQAVDVARPGRV